MGMRDLASAALLHLRHVNEHNLATLRSSPLTELSGSLGDLGTLLPLMLALTLSGSITLSSTLVFSGLTNIITGVVFGIPLPVQPMKAIASVALARSYSIEQTVSAGLAVSAAVIFFSITGLLRFFTRIVPVPVVRGIQVGAGLSLTISAGSTLLAPLGWTTPTWSDNRIWAIAVFLFLLLASLRPRAVPFALLVTILGLLLSATNASSGDPRAEPSPWLWRPSLHVPKWSTFASAAVEAGLPQLPLTTLNSILAVTSLAQSLPLPSTVPAPSTTALGISVGLANTVSAWTGAMPVCHGSGGLAAQWRFGARSGASIIMLGLIKLLLGLFVGERLVGLLQGFPKAVLGVMVLAAGVELAKVGRELGTQAALWEGAQADGGDQSGEESRKRRVQRDGEQRWTVMLVTVAGCLALKNDAVGFAAGMLWHCGLELDRRIRQRFTAEERQPLLN